MQDRRDRHRLRDRDGSVQQQVGPGILDQQAADKACAAVMVDPRLIDRRGLHHAGRIVKAGRGGPGELDGLPEAAGREAADDKIQH